MKRSILVSSVALSAAILATLMAPLANADVPHFHHPDYSGYIGYTDPGSFDVAVECTHLNNLVATIYDTWTGVGVKQWYQSNPPPYIYSSALVIFERGYGGHNEAIGNMECDWIFAGGVVGEDPYYGGTSFPADFL